MDGEFYLGEVHERGWYPARDIDVKKKVTPDAFILAASLLKPGCPVQKGFFAKTLRRFGITSSLLHHHHVEVLVHINPKRAHRTHPSHGGLDCSSAAIKLAAGFLK